MWLLTYTVDKVLWVVQLHLVIYKCITLTLKYTNFQMNEVLHRTFSLGAYIFGLKYICFVINKTTPFRGGSFFFYALKLEAYQKGTKSSKHS